MTTADYALIVSICSAAIALFSLAWNVWSKFIYPKAQLKVSFYIAAMVAGMGERAEEWPSYVCISVRNFGPTDITIQHADVLIRPSLWKKKRRAMVNPIDNLAMPDVGAGPFAGGLPKELPVGAGHSLYFPFRADSFAREPLVQVGVRDNFGRFHGCAKRDIRQVQKDLDQVFGVQNPRNADAAA